MFRYICAFYLFVLITGPVYAQTRIYVVVPPGDVAALKQAILDANTRPSDQETVIQTFGEFAFPFGVVLPHIEGAITIDGAPGAVFRGSSSRPIYSGEGEELRVEQLFYVEASGSLRLLNIELTDFILAHDGEGLIENKGELYLEQVQLSLIYGSNACAGRFVCYSAKPVIINHSSGYLDFDKVSIINSGARIVNFNVGDGGLLRNEGSAVMKNVQMYLSGAIASWDTPLRNFGDLKVQNSSFMYFDQNGSQWLELLTTSDGANTEFVNSVFAGFSGFWCQKATSLGYNLIDSFDCNWSAEGDLTGVPTGLIWRPVSSRWKILTHALVPSAASVAVDSANPDQCTSHSLGSVFRSNKDGNGDGQSGCDRGAVELVPIGLGEGGINGLYYNPEADGHYIYILQTDFTTLVVWTTFDADGNQAWVFGTGELINGRSVIADTYINRNGGVSMNGEITASEAEHWGRIEVDMTSCTEGLVAFYSDLPEFGNGQFPIERLAYVKQLGCID